MKLNDSELKYNNCRFYMRFNGDENRFDLMYSLNTIVDKHLHAF